MNIHISIESGGQDKHHDPVVSPPVFCGGRGSEPWELPQGRIKSKSGKWGHSSKSDPKSSFAFICYRYWGSSKAMSVKKKKSSATSEYFLKYCFTVFAIIIIPFRAAYFIRSTKGFLNVIITVVPWSSQRTVSRAPCGYPNPWVLKSPT